MDELRFMDPTILAIPAFIGLVALEWWAVKTGRAKGKYTTIDAIASMSMGIGSVVAGLLMGFLSVAIMFAVWKLRIYTLPVNWWSIPLAFIAYDLVYYWKHRFMHRVRWMWANHIVHHSSTHYNLTTALRQPWTGDISGTVILGLPMVWLGFHPALIAFVAGLNLIYQFWIHTEAIGRMHPWIEAVFNTPSHHRVHHGRNPRYLDSNYAGVLIVWDRMFGTFVPELDEDKPDYGLVKNIETHNILTISFHEYGAIARDCWKDGLRPDRWLRRIVFQPGWSPDGEHNDSARLKREYLEANPHLVGTPGFPAPKARGKAAAAAPPAADPAPKPEPIDA